MLLMVGHNLKNQYLPQVGTGTRLQIIRKSRKYSYPVSTNTRGFVIPSQRIRSHPKMPQFCLAYFYSSQLCGQIPLAQKNPTMKNSESAHRYGLPNFVAHLTFCRR